jgi:hypothetical protein
MKQLILIMVICAFAGAKMEAQQFETSNAMAPKWYFIYVKGSEDNAGKVVTEIDGKVLGQPVEPGFAAKAKQLWRIERVPDATGALRYESINKYSGKKLDIVYDDILEQRIAVVSDTPSTVWTISQQSVNYFYLRIVTQPKEGASGAGYLTQGGSALNSMLYFTKNANVADAQFQFISVDAPILSNEEDTVWLFVQNALNDKYLTEVETTADIQLSLQDFTDNNHYQLWKIMNNPALEGSVNFVNRATGHLISTAPIHGKYDYVRYTDAETAGWIINTLENNCYEVRTAAADLEKYWYAATEGTASAAYVKGASLNTGFAWKFRLGEDGVPTTVNVPEYDPIRILVKNRRILVEGADQYRIYTVCGAGLNENDELPAGVYLVVIKNKTIKILVR